MLSRLSSRNLLTGLGLKVFVVVTLIATSTMFMAERADAEAEPVRDGYSLALVEDGFNKPHSIRFSPDGRLFLLEQDGRVKIVRPSGVTTALTLNPADIIEPFGSAGLFRLRSHPTSIPTPRAMCICSTRTNPPPATTSRTTSLVASRLPTTS